MTLNAIILANWFVDKYNADAEHQSVTLDLLKLVKLVYLAYGYALAALNKKIIDERFDKVEAWKYGPVIPSVYHSFKHHGAEPITEKASIIQYDDNMNATFIVPTLEDCDEENKQDIEVCLEFVWQRYQLCTGKDLVDITHNPGTPWTQYYIKGENREIPDECTKWFYQMMIEKIHQGQA